MELGVAPGSITAEETVARQRSLVGVDPGNRWSPPAGAGDTRRYPRHPSSRTYGTPSEAGVPIRRFANMVDATASTTMVMT